MHGFKSFANETVIELQHGFNCVIGPNGAGKSNILDALCFVLGKSSSKGLRVEKAGNLLFNGGKHGKPATKAIVSLYFDNSKKIFPLSDDEIKLSRIVNSKGVSAYKINNKKATRAQVLDLLSAARINPEGYNIILQGDIIRFVEMSPFDRRGLIEDVSGIHVYEEKREKALRELSRVEERINEARIIISEREAYLKELKKDYEQAAKYRKLRNLVKSAKATLLNQKIKQKKLNISDVKSQVDQLNKSIQKDKASSKLIEGDVEDLKKQLKDINKQIEAKGEKEQLRLHKELEDLRVKIALSEQQLINMKSELENNNQRLQQLKNSREELKKRLLEIDMKVKDIKKRIALRQTNVRELEQKIQNLKQRHSLKAAAEVDKDLQALDEKIESINEEILNLRAKEQELLRAVDKLELMIETAKSRSERVQSLEKKDKEAIKELKSKKKQLSKISLDIDNAKKIIDKLDLELGTAQNNLLNKKEVLVRLKAQLEASRTYTNAVSEILNLKHKSVFGTISQLGVTDKRYALALDTAAGARINDIVVDNADTASKLIDFLKRKRFGVCSFLPLKELSLIKISDSVRKLTTKPGVVGLAIDLVRFDKRFEKAFRYVFGDSLIIENLNVAKRLGVGSGLRMITMDGDVVEKSGRMRGGFRASRKPMFSIINHNIKDLAKLEKEINDLETVVSRLVKTKHTESQKLESLKETKLRLEAEISTKEKQAMITLEDIEATTAEIETLKQDLKQKNLELDKLRKFIRDKLLGIANLKQEKQLLRDNLASLRSPTALAELSAFEDELKHLNTEITELRANLSILNNEKQNLLKPEHERLSKLIEQLVKDINGFKIDKKKLSDSLRNDRSLLKKMEAQENLMVKRFKGLFTKRSKISDSISKKELALRNLSNKVVANEARLNSLSIEIARLKAELAGLEEEFKGFLGVELLSNKNVSELNHIIRSNESRLETFGAVNMRALEIYDQAHQELETLNEKLLKLEHEKGDVLVMINEIDTKKKEIFLKTYNLLNKNFGATFKLLATKGEAFLELENQKDPFSGGVLIKVRLKGSKFLDIRSLSGGEKTLTALAFIFAVQEFEPAFFYVLDEVDSALDKKNSEKLSLLLKDYSRTAQYLVISHNDSIIEQSDVLFGISIDSNGVSKVTSIKLENED